MRNLEKDGPTRPHPQILLPKDAHSSVIEEAADFCESVRKKEAYCLGFIPAIAYTDAIKRGRLFIEMENDEPAGFCLWASRNRIIRIHQTAVVEDARRIKHATSIVTCVLNQPEALRAKSLRMRVAHDLPANGFWKAIGCRIIGTQPGGKTWGRTINMYELKLGRRIDTASQLIDAALAAQAHDLTPINSRS